MSSASKRTRLSDSELPNPFVIAPYRRDPSYVGIASYGVKAVLFWRNRDGERHLIRVFLPEFDLWLRYHTRNTPTASALQNELIIHQNKMITVGREGKCISSLDLKTMEWSSNACRGDIPCSPTSTAFVLDDNMWLYNGDGLFRCNLSVDRHIWVQPRQNGDIPTLREDATLTNMGDERAVLFGGSHPDPPYTTYNEVYVLNINALSWARVEIVQGSKPLSRYDQAAVRIDERRIAIIGGIHKSAEGFQRLNDVWILDTEIWYWTQISDPPYFKPGEVRAARVSDKIYILDGERVAVMRIPELMTKNPESLLSMAVKILARSDIPVSLHQLPKQPRGIQQIFALMRHEKEQRVKRISPTSHR